MTGRRVAIAAAAAAAAVAVVVPGPAAGAAPASDPVPVLGRTVTYPSGSTEGQPVVTLIHGVRRIPGGTALYYSVGAPATDRPYRAWVGWYEVSLVERYRRTDSIPTSSVHLIDTAGRQVYSTMIDRDGLGIASDTGSSWPLLARAGQLLVQYAVFPPLPASVSSVDVQVGRTDLVQAVPVQDGAMTPAVAPAAPIPLGTGWPAIDPATVAAADDPSGSVYPWVTTVSDLDDAVTRRARPRSLSVDLAADVLFAVDRATLTAAARAAIATAAAQVNSGAPAGSTVTVTGYTDDTGTGPYNRGLSRRRAVAVRAALEPQLSVAVRLEVAGRGEADPVAVNTTAAGRRENRRVSVAFTPKGQ